MELRQLYQFQAIVQYGNLTRAAEALLMAQPNLSRTLRALEKELGTPLFEREKGRLILNTSGKKLYELTQRIFQDIEETVQNIRNSCGSAIPCLRLSMTAISTVSECIAQFHQAHPDILLYQTNCSEKQLFHLLLQRETDLGITMKYFHEPMISMVQLARFEVAAGVSPGHPLAQQDWVRWDELQQYRFLCNETGINQGLTEQLCHQAGFSPREALVLGDNHLINSQMAQRKYVTLFPLESTHQQIPMKVLHIQDRPQYVTLWACYNRTKPPTGPARELLEQMQRFYQE